MTSPGNYKFTTHEQELVLKASLLDRNEAIAAWQEWVSSADIEGYHHDVFRLLPLLYHNLSKHKVKHPFMKRLKGIYKMFWYQNKKLLHENTKILKDFNDLGIETLLFKGAPIAILHYKNIGLRPMNDVDILVKKSSIKKALCYLRNEGWSPKLKPVKDELKYNNGVGFTDINGNEFDIHLHPLEESIWEQNHDDFWENSVPLKINDFETKSFSSTDLLLHTIIHGIKWNPEPPVRWIADCFYLINCSNDKIDWDRFIYLTKKYDLALKIKNSLYYLKDIFNLVIPQTVMKQVDQIKISKLDKLEYNFIINDPKNFSEKLTGNLFYHIVCFRHVAGNSPFLKRISMFPDYLRYRYDCPNTGSLIRLFITLFIKRASLRLISIISNKMNKEIKSEKGAK